MHYCNLKAYFHYGWALRLTDSKKAIALKHSKHCAAHCDRNRNTISVSISDAMQSASQQNSSAIVSLWVSLKFVFLLSLWNVPMHFKWHWSDSTWQLSHNRTERAAIEGKCYFTIQLNKTVYVYMCLYHYPERLQDGFYPSFLHTLFTQKQKAQKNQWLT